MIGARIIEGRRRPVLRVQEARRLFSAFRYAHRQDLYPLPDLLAEADHRLEQIHFIIARVKTIEDAEDRQRRNRHRKPESRHAPSRVERAKQTRDGRLGTEVTVLCEAFYYFANRVIDILNACKGFRKVRVDGVQNVRHHLVEHPEKHSKAVNWNFVWGKDVTCGPILKPYGGRSSISAREHIEVHDQGMYVNAQEFFNELVRRLGTEKGGE